MSEEGENWVREGWREMDEGWGAEIGDRDREREGGRRERS